MSLTIDNSIFSSYRLVLSLILLIFKVPHHCTSAGAPSFTELEEVYTLLRTQAGEIPLSQFEDDQTLFQKWDGDGGTTQYWHPKFHQGAKPVYETHQNDLGKQVILLNGNEDKIPRTKQLKQTYVILRKKHGVPGEDAEYYPMFAYLRNSRQNEVCPSFTLGLVRKCVEWDNWEMRAGGEEPTIWSDCSSSVFLACGFNASVFDSDADYKPIVSLENDDKDDSPTLKPPPEENYDDLPANLDYLNQTDYDFFDDLHGYPKKTRKVRSANNRGGGGYNGYSGTCSPKPAPVQYCKPKPACNCNSGGGGGNSYAPPPPSYSSPPPPPSVQNQRSFVQVSIGYNQQHYRPASPPPNAKYDMYGNLVSNVVGTVGCIITSFFGGCQGHGQQANYNPAPPSYHPPPPPYYSPPPPPYYPPPSANSGVTRSSKVDPCLPNPCGRYSVCANDNGAALCSCAGEGQPPLCKPGPCSPSPCGANSNCTVANQKPECTCLKNFVGKPPDCLADPCSPSPCGPNSICNTVGGKADCSCLPDFSGTPPSCRSECSTDGECPLNLACSNMKCINPCEKVCSKNAECSVRSHVPVCTCPPDYIGDPLKDCQPKPPESAPLTPPPCKNCKDSKLLVKANYRNYQPIGKIDVTPYRISTTSGAFNPENVELNSIPGTMYVYGPGYLDVFQATDPNTFGTELPDDRGSVGSYSPESGDDPNSNLHGVLLPINSEIAFFVRDGLAFPASFTGSGVPETRGFVVPIKHKNMELFYPDSFVSNNLVLNLPLLKPIDGKLNPTFGSEKKFKTLEGTLLPSRWGASKFVRPETGFGYGVCKSPKQTVKCVRIAGVDGSPDTYYGLEEPLKYSTTEPVKPVESTYEEGDHPVSGIPAGPGKLPGRPDYFVSLDYFIVEPVTIKMNDKSVEMPGFIILDKENPTISDDGVKVFMPGVQLECPLRNVEATLKREDGDIIKGYLSVPTIEDPKIFVPKEGTPKVKVKSKALYPDYHPLGSVEVELPEKCLKEEYTGTFHPDDSQWPEMEATFVSFGPDNLDIVTMLSPVFGDQFPEEYSITGTFKPGDNGNGAKSIHGVLIPIDTKRGALLRDGMGYACTFKPKKPKGKMNEMIGFVVRHGKSSRLSFYPESYKVFNAYRLNPFKPLEGECSPSKSLQDEFPPMKGYLLPRRYGHSIFINAEDYFEGTFQDEEESYPALTVIVVKAADACYDEYYPIEEDGYTFDDLVVRGHITLKSSRRKRDSDEVIKIKKSKAATRKPFVAPPKKPVTTPKPTEPPPTVKPTEAPKTTPAPTVKVLTTPKSTQKSKVELNTTPKPTAKPTHAPKKPAKRKCDRKIVDITVVGSPISGMPDLFINSNVFEAISIAFKPSKGTAPSIIGYLIFDQLSSFPPDDPMTITVSMKPTVPFPSNAMGSLMMMTGPDDYEPGHGFLQINSPNGPIFTYCPEDPSKTSKKQKPKKSDTRYPTYKPIGSDNLPPIQYNVGQTSGTFTPDKTPNEAFPMKMIVKGVDKPDVVSSSSPTFGSDADLPLEVGTPGTYTPDKKFAKVEPVHGVLLPVDDSFGYLIRDGIGITASFKANKGTSDILGILVPSLKKAIDYFYPDTNGKFSEIPKPNEIVGVVDPEDDLPNIPGIMLPKKDGPWVFLRDSINPEQGIFTDKKSTYPPVKVYAVKGVKGQPDEFYPLDEDAIPEDEGVVKGKIKVGSKSKPGTIIRKPGKDIPDEFMPEDGLEFVKSTFTPNKQKKPSEGFLVLPIDSPMPPTKPVEIVFDSTNFPFPASLPGKLKIPPDDIEITGTVLTTSAGGPHQFVPKIGKDSFIEEPDKKRIDEVTEKLNSDDTDSGKEASREKPMDDRKYPTYKDYGSVDSPDKSKGVTTGFFTPNFENGGKKISIAVHTPASHYQLAMAESEEPIFGKIIPEDRGTEGTYSPPEGTNVHGILIPIDEFRAYLLPDGVALPGAFTSKNENSPVLSGFLIPSKDSPVTDFYPESFVTFLKTIRKRVVEGELKPDQSSDTYPVRKGKLVLREQGSSKFIPDEAKPVEAKFKPSQGKRPASAIYVVKGEKGRPDEFIPIEDISDSDDTKKPTQGAVILPDKDKSKKGKQKIVVHPGIHGRPDEFIPEFTGQSQEVELTSNEVDLGKLKGYIVLATDHEGPLVEPTPVTIYNNMEKVPGRINATVKMADGTKIKGLLAADSPSGPFTFHPGKRNPAVSSVKPVPAASVQPEEGDDDNPDSEFEIKGSENVQVDKSNSKDVVKPEDDLKSTEKKVSTKYPTYKQKGSNKDKVEYLLGESTGVFIPDDDGLRKLPMNLIVRGKNKLDMVHSEDTIFSDNDYPDDEGTPGTYTSADKRRNNKPVHGVLVPINDKRGFLVRDGVACTVKFIPEDKKLTPTVGFVVPQLLKNPAPDHFIPDSFPALQKIYPTDISLEGHMNPDKEVPSSSPPMNGTLILHPDKFSIFIPKSMKPAKESFQDDGGKRPPAEVYVISGENDGPDQFYPVDDIIQDDKLPVAGTIEYKNGKSKKATAVISNNEDAPENILPENEAQITPVFITSRDDNVPDSHLITAQAIFKPGQNNFKNPTPININRIQPLPCRIPVTAETPDGSSVEGDLIEDYPGGSFTFIPKKKGSKETVPESTTKSNLKDTAGGPNRYPTYSQNAGIPPLLAQPVGVSHGSVAPDKGHKRPFMAAVNNIKDKLPVVEFEDAVFSKKPEPMPATYTPENRQKPGKPVHGVIVPIDENSGYLIPDDVSYTATFTPNDKKNCPTMKGFVLPASQSKTRVADEFIPESYIELKKSLINPSNPATLCDGKLIPDKEPAKFHDETQGKMIIHPIGPSDFIPNDLNPQDAKFETEDGSQSAKAIIVPANKAKNKPEKIFSLEDINFEDDKPVKGSVESEDTSIPATLLPTKEPGSLDPIVPHDEHNLVPVTVKTNIPNSPFKNIEGFLISPEFNEQKAAPKKAIPIILPSFESSKKTGPLREEVNVVTPDGTETIGLLIQEMPKGPFTFLPGMKNPKPNEDDSGHESKPTNFPEYTQYGTSDSPVEYVQGVSKGTVIPDKGVKKRSPAVANVAGIDKLDVINLEDPVIGSDLPDETATLVTYTPDDKDTNAAPLRGLLIPVDKKTSFLIRDGIGYTATFYPSEVTDPIPGIVLPSISGDRIADNFVPESFIRYADNLKKPVIYGTLVPDKEVEEYFPNTNGKLYTRPKAPSIFLNDESSDDVIGTFQDENESHPPKKIIVIPNDKDKPAEYYPTEALLPDDETEPVKGTITTPEKDLSVIAIAKKKTPGKVVDPEKVNPRKVSFSGKHPPVSGFLLAPSSSKDISKFPTPVFVADDTDDLPNRMDTTMETDGENIEGLLVSDDPNGSDFTFHPGAKDPAPTDDENNDGGGAKKKKQKKVPLKKNVAKGTATDDTSKKPKPSKSKGAFENAKGKDKAGTKEYSPDDYSQYEDDNPKDVKGKKDKKNPGAVEDNEDGSGTDTSDEEMPPSKKGKKEKLSNKKGKDKKKAKPGLYPTYVPLGVDSEPVLYNFGEFPGTFVEDNDPSKRFTVKVQVFGEDQPDILISQDPIFGDDLPDNKATIGMITPDQEKSNHNHSPIHGALLPIDASTALIIRDGQGYSVTAEIEDVDGPVHGFFLPLTKSPIEMFYPDSLLEFEPISQELKARETPADVEIIPDAEVKSIFHGAQGKLLPKKNSNVFIPNGKHRKPTKNSVFVDEDGEHTVPVNVVKGTLAEMNTEYITIAGKLPKLKAPVKGTVSIPYIKEPVPATVISLPEPGKTAEYRVYPDDDYTVQPVKVTSKDKKIKNKEAYLITPKNPDSKHKKELVFSTYITPFPTDNIPVTVLIDGAENYEAVLTTILGSGPHVLQSQEDLPTDNDDDADTEEQVGGKLKKHTPQYKLNGKPKTPSKSTSSKTKDWPDAQAYQPLEEGGAPNNDKAAKPHDKAKPKAPKKSVLAMIVPLDPTDNPNIPQLRGKVPIKIPKNGEAVFFIQDDDDDSDLPKYYRGYLKIPGNEDDITGSLIPPKKESLPSQFLVDPENSEPAIFSTKINPRKKTYGYLETKEGASYFHPDDSNQEVDDDTPGVLVTPTNSKLNVVLQPPSKKGKPSAFVQAEESLENKAKPGADAEFFPDNPLTDSFDGTVDKDKFTMKDNGGIDRTLLPLHGSIVYSDTKTTSENVFVEEDGNDDVLKIKRHVSNYTVVEFVIDASEKTIGVYFAFEEGNTMGLYRLSDSSKHPPEKKNGILYKRKSLDDPIGMGIMVKKDDNEYSFEITSKFAFAATFVPDLESGEMEGIYFQPNEKQAGYSAELHISESSTILENLPASGTLVPKTAKHGQKHGVLKPGNAANIFYFVDDSDKPPEYEICFTSVKEERDDTLDLSTMSVSVRGHTFSGPAGINVFIPICGALGHLVLKGIAPTDPNVEKFEGRLQNADEEMLSSGEMYNFIFYPDYEQDDNAAPDGFDSGVKAIFYPMGAVVGGLHGHVTQIDEYTWAFVVVTEPYKWKPLPGVTEFTFDDKGQIVAYDAEFIKLRKKEREKISGKKIKGGYYQGKNGVQIIIPEGIKSGVMLKFSEDEMVHGEVSPVGRGERLQFFPDDPETTEKLLESNQGEMDGNVEVDESWNSQGKTPGNAFKVTFKKLNDDFYFVPKEKYQWGFFIPGKKGLPGVVIMMLDMFSTESKFETPTYFKQETSKASTVGLGRSLGDENSKGRCMRLNESYYVHEPEGDERVVLQVCRVPDDGHVAIEDRKGYYPFNEVNDDEMEGNDNIRVGVAYPTSTKSHIFVTHNGAKGVFRVKETGVTPEDMTKIPGRIYNTPDLKRLGFKPDDLGKLLEVVRGSVSGTFKTKYGIGEEGWLEGTLKVNSKGAMGRIEIKQLGEFGALYLTGRERKVSGGEKKGRTFVNPLLDDHEGFAATGKVHGYMFNTTGKETFIPGNMDVQSNFKYKNAQGEETEESVFFNPTYGLVYTESVFTKQFKSSIHVNSSLEGTLHIPGVKGIIPAKLTKSPKVPIAYLFTPHISYMIGWLVVKKSLTGGPAEEDFINDDDIDIYQHPGWKTQFTLVEAGLLKSFDNRVFYGLGNCPYDDRIRERDFLKLQRKEDIVLFFLKVLRTNCLKTHVERAKSFLTDGILHISLDPEGRNVLMINKSHPIMTISKLTKTQAAKLSSSFELAVLSQTYLNQFTTRILANPAKSPNGNSISRTAQFFTRMVVFAIKESRQVLGKHFVRIMRNWITTLNTAIAKLDQDIERLKGCRECETDLAVTLNDKTQLVALAQFITHNVRYTSTDDKVLINFRGYFKANYQTIKKLATKS